MTTRYVDIADAATFTRTVADLDAAYMASMRARLGRGPAETIDTVLEPMTHRRLGPAGRTITTKLVDPVTVAGTSGGVIPVEDEARAYSGTTAPSGRAVTLNEVDLSAVRVALRTVIQARSAG